MIIPKFIFIIPYRNREQHKLHFDIYMKYLLEDYNINDYKIFFVNQCDNNVFNRGAMKNIGFLVIKNLYPNDYKNINFIFNDIDTLPYKKNLLNYETKQGVIKHYYGFQFALGGIFSIKGQDFEKINGFPNIWGWGLEDNELNNRAKNKGIIIDRNQFYKINNHNILHIFDSESKIISKQTPWYYKDKVLDNLFDIKNLNYKIENNFINVLNFETKYDANKEFYQKETNLHKIVADNKFIPKNSKWSLRKLKF